MPQIVIFYLNKTESRYGVLPLFEYLSVKRSFPKEDIELLNLKICFTQQGYSKFAKACYQSTK